MIENKKQYNITKTKIQEIEAVISKSKDNLLKAKAADNSLIQMKNHMKKEIAAYKRLLINSICIHQCK